MEPVLATELFALAVTVHNLEEAIWLPGFAAGTGSSSIAPSDFRISVVLLTLVFYAVSMTVLNRLFPLGG